MRSLAISCVIALVTGNASGYNMVANGDFALRLDSWLAGSPLVVVEGPHESARFYGSPSAYGWADNSVLLAQLVPPTIGGQNYVLEFDLASVGVTDPFRAVTSGVSTPPGWFYCGVSICFYRDVTPFVQVSFGGLLFEPQQGVVPQSHYTFLVPGTGVESLLLFRAETGPGFYELDNVSLTAVSAAIPEPTTALLLGLGLAGLGFARRKQ